MSSVSGMGRNSSVGIETGRSGYRILVEVRFSTPFQTGPVALPFSYTMGRIIPEDKAAGAWC